MPEPTRCEWAGTDPLMVAYHDDDWGVPTHDDAALFELLTLEGAQAGLSWRTILYKRDGYRAAFAAHDADRVARYTDADVDRLVTDPSIVRHRGKIESTINNAQAVQRVRDEFDAFDAYVWQSVDGEPIVGAFTQLQQLPAVTAESTALSKDLKRRGFRFVGPTTVYAFMQAAGLVDDTWSPASGMVPAPLDDRRSMNDAVGERRERRRRRHGTALVVAAVVLLVVALAAGAASLVVRNDTSDLQARTEPLQRRLRRLTANELHAERRLHAVRQRSAGVTAGLAVLFAAYQAQVEASNHAVDVANQGVGQYNRAQAGIAAAFQAAGDAAIADVEQKTAAVNAAVTAVQTEINALAQVSRG